MSTIHIRASRPYDVTIERGLLTRTGETLARLHQGRRAVIVSDSNVMPLYGTRTADSLHAAGFSVDSVTFPAGEASKSPAQLIDLLETLAGLGLKRSDLLVALGGGVTGDLSGLAGSLYMRGIPVLQIPTSLLAMVDSSVGGKTAVNLPQGKNLMGTFSQPLAVLCDPELLATLPAIETANGWGEIVKYAFLKKDVLLPLLLKPTIDSESLLAVIGECISIKRDIVGEDEFESGRRALLNFGHTVGHAVEAVTRYGIGHGRAVAIGMAVITRMALLDGSCPPEAESRLRELLDKFDLPSDCPWDAAELAAAVRSDKKSAADLIKLVWPEDIGRCTLRTMSFDDFEKRLAAALRSMQEMR